MWDAWTHVHWAPVSSRRADVTNEDHAGFGLLAETCQLYFIAAQFVCSLNSMKLCSSGTLMLSSCLCAFCKSMIVTCYITIAAKTSQLVCLLSRVLRLGCIFDGILRSRTLIPSRAECTVSPSLSKQTRTSTITSSRFSADPPTCACPVN